MVGGPDLVCHPENIGSKRIARMVAALLDGTYAMEEGSDVPNAIGLAGIQLEAHMPRGMMKLPLISFRTLNSPLTPPHDAIRTAIRCLRAPILAPGDVKRVRDALTASACQNSTRTSRSTNPDNTLMAIGASPWSRHRIMERDAEGTPWSDVGHDGSIEAIMPHAVQISQITGPERNGGTTVLIHPMTMVVDDARMMDPMETMTIVARLERMPIRGQKQ